jgi:lipid II isoglutaminyl synthase (glutamine-hydrolysing)
LRLRLVHLYPDLMSLYGDRGNIIALKRRSEWRGIDLDVQELTLGDRLDPDTTDLIFFGGGQDKEQETVSRDLATGVGEAVQEAVQGGAALLSVCGGYQLLSRYFRTSEGVDIPGVGLFDAYTVAGDRRMVGDVLVNAELDGSEVPLVGFENHSGQTFLGPAVEPLGKVTLGNGNNGEDGTEGARYRGAIGTYLHGPLLPKNPQLADWLLKTALTRRHADVELSPLDDELEIQAHSAVSDKIRRSGPRRSSIR